MSGVSPRFSEPRRNGNAAGDLSARESRRRLRTTCGRARSTKAWISGGLPAGPVGPSQAGSASGYPRGVTSGRVTNAGDGSQRGVTPRRWLIALLLLAEKITAFLYRGTGVSPVFLIPHRRDACATDANPLGEKEAAALRTPYGRDRSTEAVQQLLVAAGPGRPSPAAATSSCCTAG